MDQPVLLTGAGGRVGRAILEGLGDSYDWRLLDREPLLPERIPQSVDEADIYVADITDEDAIRTAMDGVGSIIHLAGDPRKTAPWESVLQNNIDGARTVFQAAVEEDVSKIAFASSNHVVSAYETDDRTPEMYREGGESPQLDGSESSRPGNLYGVSKATGELLGRYYHDMAEISVVCVRIGNLTRDHPPHDYERGHAMWLSWRDCAHLFERCLRADYGFEVVYGISDNDRRYYSIQGARDRLGYEPRDNSAEFSLDGSTRQTTSEK